ncbi:MAG: radical SAM protein [Selenomonadaceae bacterium]|nr:radical SAM protein [Selenomonadaceae bacterium]
MSEVTALYADEEGNILDIPGLGAMGRIGSQEIILKPEDLIPLPPGSDLMFMPGRQAVGCSSDGEVLPVAGLAVAAIIPPGYTRTHVPAYRIDSENEDSSKPLPLYGYTAVAVYNDELYVAAIHTDEQNDKWNPEHYNTKNLTKLVKKVKKDLAGNRLVEHLSNCALTWHCQTAENLFYHRWEAGIPASPVCNAKCLGCISLQPAECCPSPQSRIKFRPTAKEIAEIGVYHLTVAPEGIVSFGQGCEGEPSLSADNIADGIKAIREKTDKGQININTNGGFTAGIKKIVDAGLNSMRVSIISARPDSYKAYYRCSYELSAVKESIRYALEHDVYVSLNLLYFPGFNDRAEEVAAWQDFLKELPVQMIQMRNLNIDPDWFLRTMPEAQSDAIGTARFMNALKEAQPDIVIGSFSHYVED